MLPVFGWESHGIGCIVSLKRCSLPEIAMVLPIFIYCQYLSFQIFEMTLGYPYIVEELLVAQIYKHSDKCLMTATGIIQCFSNTVPLT